MPYLYKALKVSSYTELVEKVNSFKTAEQLFGCFKTKEVFDILLQLQFDRRLLYLFQEHNVEKAKKPNYMDEYISE